MKRIHEFVRWFLYITTCVLFVCAANLSISGEDTIPAHMLWQILLCGLFTALITTCFWSNEAVDGIVGIIKTIIHYIVLCAVMIIFGSRFGWMQFSPGSIAMMMLSVAVVYLLVFLASYWIDRQSCLLYTNITDGLACLRVCDIISAKGRVRCLNAQMPSLLGQMCIWTSDERSEPGKPQVFRVSARHR